MSFDDAMQEYLAAVAAADRALKEKIRTRDIYEAEEAASKVRLRALFSVYDYASAEASEKQQLMAAADAELAVTIIKLRQRER